MNIHTRSLLAAAGAGGGAMEGTPFTLSFTNAPASGTSNVYDMGTAFTPAQNLWAVAGRAYLLNSTDLSYDMRLWDSRDTATPIASTTVIGVGAAWTEPVDFNEYVLLEAGVQYRIIARCHTGYYSHSKAYFTFDTALATADGGCYTNSPGAYPSSLAANNIYGFSDILVATA